MRLVIAIVIVALLLLLASAGYGRWRLAAEADRPETIAATVRVPESEADGTWERWRPSDWTEAGELFDAARFSGHGWTADRVTKWTGTTTRTILEIRVGWPFPVLSGATAIDGDGTVGRGALMVGDEPVPITPIVSLMSVASAVIAAVVAWVLCRGVVFVFGGRAGGSTTAD